MGGDLPHEGSTKTPRDVDELGGLVVLVVDDEPVVRAYVARGLALAGMDVAVAANGREALRLVAEDRVRPRVVVTDIEMPAMSGVELAARLLAIRPSIRIVMMTGDPERAEAARRHPAIVDDVLLKPMRIEDVVATVLAVAAADDRRGEPRPPGRTGAGASRTGTVDGR
jgi:two-component system, OmpR family, response regulator PrrA